MKRNVLYSAYIPFAIVLIIIAFVNPQFLASKRNDLFIASIGLLTFTSIFYGFTIDKGEKKLFDISKYFKQKKDEKIKRLTNDLKKDKNQSQKINEMLKESKQFDERKEYLNLNKWLFVSLVSYFASILLHLTTDNNLVIFILIQHLFFWFAFYTTILLVSVSYAVNEVSLRNKNS